MIDQGSPPFLRDRLRSNEPLGVFWAALGSPAVVEIAAASRADAIVLDVQHGLWDRQSIEQAIGTVGGRVPVLVRTLDGAPGSISTALDAGAEGVIVPLIETAEEAAAAAAAGRYPPKGRRSGGGVRPLMDFGAYYRRADERTIVGVMIETVPGVENAAAIAATPGIDFVLIGTGDLSLSLGVSAQPDPRHEQACRTVHEACRDAGLPCAIFTMNAGEAARRAAEGYALTVLANDMDLLASGFAGAAAQFAQACAAPAKGKGRSKAK